MSSSSNSEEASATGSCSSSDTFSTTSLDEETQIEQQQHDERARQQFLNACDANMRNVLRRLSDQLRAACSALNRLSNSTYVHDKTLGAALLEQINYATRQRDRIERFLEF